MGAPVMRADRGPVGGWELGPVIGRRPAGPLREAFEPLSGRRAVLVLVDERFHPAEAPDSDAVIRAASVEHPGIAPMLDAGLLDDGTPWYVCDPLPGAVLDPDESRSPRRALVLAEDVALALTALHADGVVHGLVGPLTVVPGGGRHGGEPTLLLDAGVAALVGSAAPTLAATCGVALPADRGPAADVYALGGLLLRLLTNAASPTAALAALPLEVRALLSSLLDPDPARRPTAGATAARLARLREQVPATGAVPVLPAPARPAPNAYSAPIPAYAAPPKSAPTPLSPPPIPVSAPPTPVPAPRTVESPISIPRLAPDVAPTLRTGPVAVRPTPFPRPARTGGVPVPRKRRGTARRMLAAGGGVALAGLLVAIVTHLPSGPEAGVRAIAAGADDAVVGVGGAGPGSTSPALSGPVVAPTASTSTAAPESAAIRQTATTPPRPSTTASRTPLSAARGQSSRTASPAAAPTTRPPTTSPSARPASTTSSAPTAARSPSPASSATPSPTTTSPESATASAAASASASPTPSASVSPSPTTTTPTLTATP